MIGNLNLKRAFIQLNHEADYHRIWLKEQWCMGSFPMRIFKWTTDFRPKKETSIVPLWVFLLGLSIHLFHKTTIFSTWNLIGKPWTIDTRTDSLSRLSLARISVEIDIAKPIPKRIWIDIASLFRTQLGAQRTVPLQREHPSTEPD